MIVLRPSPLVVSSPGPVRALAPVPLAPPALGSFSGGAAQPAAVPAPAPGAPRCRTGGVSGRERGRCRPCVLSRAPRPRAGGAQPPPWCPVAAAGRGGPAPGAEQLRGCHVLAGEGGPGQEAVRPPAAEAARVHRGGGRGRPALLPVRRRYGAAAGRGRAPGLCGGTREREGAGKARERGRGSAPPGRSGAAPRPAGPLPGTARSPAGCSRSPVTQRSVPLGSHRLQV